MEADYWVYLDLIRKRCTVHTGTCPYCNRGRGFHHLVSGRTGGEWSGPFFTIDEAMDFARGLERPIHPCSNCMDGMEP